MQGWRCMDVWHHFVSAVLCLLSAPITQEPWGSIFIIWHIYISQGTSTLHTNVLFDLIFLKAQKLIKSSFQDLSFKFPWAFLRVYRYIGSFTQDICIWVNVSKDTSETPQTLHVPSLPLSVWTGWTGWRQSLLYLWQSQGTPTLEARWPVRKHGWVIDNWVLVTAMPHSEGHMAYLENITNWYSICGRLILQVLVKLYHQNYFL